MKTIILIIALSACVLGIASAAPYPVSSSETALLNRIMTAEKTAQMQGVEDGEDYKAFQELMESIQSITSGGYTNIQESEDAEAQFWGTLGIVAATLLPEIINALGKVTIQENEDIADLQTLLENVESSSMDEEAKVQFVRGFLKELKGAVKKIFPRAFGLINKEGKKAWEFIKKLSPGFVVSDLVDAIGGSIQAQGSEDIANLQSLLENIELSSMDEEAKAQFIGALLKGLKGFPKALGLLKTGGKTVWNFLDKLTPGLLVSDVIGAVGGSTQTQESEDDVNMKHLLQTMESTSNGMNDEADAETIKNHILRNTIGRLGSYIIKKNPKLVEYINSGTVGAFLGAAADRLLETIFGDKMMAQASAKAGKVPHLEKLFKLLNKKPKGGTDKEAKASFY